MHFNSVSAGIFKQEKRFYEGERGEFLLSSSSKINLLKNFIHEKGRNGVVIAFSGGVDSSTLAKLSYDVLKEKAVAVTIDSPVYSRHEISQAVKIAKQIGIKHYLVKANELEDKNFVLNNLNRCYICKKNLIFQLKKFAAKINFKVIFEGTNASELKGHRPGYRAVQEERGVYSPWAEFNFTKEEIREIAKRLKLANYSKPPNACLASRIPFGQKITLEKLKRIEEAENYIKKLTKVKLVRVRDHNGLARIEVGKNEKTKLLDPEIIEKINWKLKQVGFKFVTLDLEGYRTGSLLEERDK